MHHKNVLRTAVQFSTALHRVTEKPKASPAANRSAPSPGKHPCTHILASISSFPSHHLLFGEAMAFFPAHLLLCSTSVPSRPLRVPCLWLWAKHHPGAAPATTCQRDSPNPTTAWGSLALPCAAKHGYDGLTNLLASQSQHQEKIAEVLQKHQKIHPKSDPRGLPNCSHGVTTLKAF